MLDTLNDDCLLEIFRFLDLRNLIVADQVCRKFRETAQIIYRQFRYHEIDIRREGNLSGRILARIGEHLKELFFTCGYLMVPTKIIGSIGKYCTNLEKLTLQYLTLGDVDLTLLEDVFLKLKILELKWVRVSHIHAPLAFVLNAPKLQRLKLHCFDNKYEDHFLSLVTIQNPNLILEKNPVEPMIWQIN